MKEKFSIYKPFISLSFSTGVSHQSGAPSGWVGLGANYSSSSNQVLSQF